MNYTQIMTTVALRLQDTSRALQDLCELAETLQRENRRLIRQLKRSQKDRRRLLRKMHQYMQYRSCRYCGDCYTVDPSIPLHVLGFCSQECQNKYGAEP